MELETTSPDAGEPQALTRQQRRLLRRIFNGRTVPLVTEGRSFLTYRDAARHLLSLPDEARESAYAGMKAAASET